MPHAGHFERRDGSCRAPRRVMPRAATGHAEPFASLRVNAARNLSGSRTTPRTARGDHAGCAQVIGMRGARREGRGAGGEARGERHGARGERREARGTGRGGRGERREARDTGRGVIPMTLDDAACVSFRAQRLVIPSAATGRSERSDWSFRALRFAQGKRSEESARVAHAPARCSARPCRMCTGHWYDSASGVIANDSDAIAPRSGNRLAADAPRNDNTAKTRLLSSKLI
ncbi:MAG: hypothetical protein KatS3mg058_3097 [Roseiflexus sp.]|nr:MAG: hypothetical protein KatS3mg058_3097 [Roseiflexus sp.]